MNYLTLVSEGVIDLNARIIHSACNCPACDAPANKRYFDSYYSGCLNQQTAVECPSCNYHSCDDESCLICIERDNVLKQKKICQQLEITNSVSAYFFLSNLETEIMVIKSLHDLYKTSEPDISAFKLEFGNRIEEISELLYQFMETDYMVLPLVIDIMEEIALKYRDLYKSLHEQRTIAVSFTTSD